MDGKVGKPFGFICFEKHESAAQAIEDLNDSDPLATGEKLYVGWAMTKAERFRTLNEKE